MLQIRLSGHDAGTRIPLAVLLVPEERTDEIMIAAIAKNEVQALTDTDRHFKNPPLIYCNSYLHKILTMPMDFDD